MSGCVIYGFIVILAPITEGVGAPLPDPKYGRVKNTEGHNWDAPNRSMLGQAV